MEQKELERLIAEAQHREQVAKEANLLAAFAKADPKRAETQEIRVFDLAKPVLVDNERPYTITRLRIISSDDDTEARIEGLGTPANRDGTTRTNGTPRWVYVPQTLLTLLRPKGNDIGSERDTSEAT